MQRNRLYAGAKIPAVGKKLGIQGLEKMQGTTRSIYDSLKLQNTTTNTVLTFFQNVKNRQFPFTNLSENKLQVGEALAMQRYSLMVIEFQPSTQAVKSVNCLAALSEFKVLYRSDLSFNIAQDQVVKNQPTHNMYSAFNKDAKFNGSQTFGTNPGLTSSFEVSHDVFHFDNNIVIPPNIEFTAQLQITPVTLPATPDREWHLCLTLEGLGSLYAPKANY